MPVMINPAVMAHPDTDAQMANVDAHVVETDASRNGAEVCSNAGTAPTVATCVIYADAAHSCARLGWHECDRGSR